MLLITFGQACELNNAMFMYHKHIGLTMTQSVLCYTLTKIPIIVACSLKVNNKAMELYLYHNLIEEKKNLVHHKDNKVLIVTSHIYCVKCLFFDTKKNIKILIAFHYIRIYTFVSIIKF